MTTDEIQIDIDAETDIVPVGNLTARADTAWMARLPPNVLSAAALMPPVDHDEMQAHIDNLPEDKQSKYRDLLAKMNPSKPGMVVADSSFAVFTAKIFHGVGDDPARHPDAPRGSVFTSDGRVIAAAQKEVAKKLGFQATFKAAVIGLFEERAWWPGKGADFKFPMGVDPELKGPICSSHDRNQGTRYGSCKACPYRPFANGKMAPNSCKDGVRLFLMLDDFSGFYDMLLTGTSVKFAASVLRKRFNSQIEPWDSWFEFSLQEEKKNGNAWFSLVATPVSEGGATSPEERSLFRALSRQVMNELFLPKLRTVYDNQTVAATITAGADMSALAANAEATTTAAADYSGDNL